MSKSTTRLNSEKKLGEIVSFSEYGYDYGNNIHNPTQSKNRISFRQSIKQSIPTITTTMRKNQNDDGLTKSTNNYSGYNRDKSRDSQLLEYSKVSSPKNNKISIEMNKADIKSENKDCDVINPEGKSLKLDKKKETNINSLNTEFYAGDGKFATKTKKFDKINKNTTTPRNALNIQQHEISSLSNIQSHTIANISNPAMIINNNNNQVIQRTKINLKSNLNFDDRRDSHSIKGSSENSPRTTFDSRKKSLNLDLNKIKKMNNGHDSAQSSKLNSPHNNNNHQNHVNEKEFHSQQKHPNNSDTFSIFSPSTINSNNINNLFMNSSKPLLNSVENNKTNGLTSTTPDLSLANPSISQDHLVSNKIIAFESKQTIEENPNISKKISHDIKVRSSNIKVVARFRPLNKIETELLQNGLGNEIVIYPDENSVAILPDSQIFTFDKVFNSISQQAEIYACVGKETIEDVLNGYNGTIFTYGQTSSGKTYTMYGDVHNEEKQGIVPRSSKNIFEYIASVDFEVDFVLSCSMLEIYKETLYDLLNSERTIDLKIKESPHRGIYVEGLTQISVVNEQELMEVLEIGERAKTVAATRINQFSSRSHTIFIMEITQRYTNMTEKTGKLNLVDLAGSEKVGKTGAVGELLEEAKKINLSLSCLGNVIHSLTTNCEHIPYRDSKLTRLLQESLGGNFRTSLIVTCSPHSSNREETISSLKFASRAKCIKNHFKMNIHNSPEALVVIIEQLKSELEECKIELSKYRGEIYEKSRTNLLTNPLSSRRYEDLQSNPSTTLLLHSSPSNINLSQINKSSMFQSKRIISKAHSNNINDNNNNTACNINENYFKFNAMGKIDMASSCMLNKNIQIEEIKLMDSNNTGNTQENNSNLVSNNSQNSKSGNDNSDYQLGNQINLDVIHEQISPKSNKLNFVKKNQLKFNENVLSPPIDVDIDHENSIHPLLNKPNIIEKDDNIANELKDNIIRNDNKMKETTQTLLNGEFNTDQHSDSFTNTNNIILNNNNNNSMNFTKDSIIRTLTNEKNNNNNTICPNDDINNNTTKYVRNNDKSNIKNKNNTTNNLINDMKAYNKEDENINRQYENYNNIKYAYSKTNTELKNQNEVLSMNLKDMKIENDNLKKILLDKEKKIQKQENEIMNLKNSLMQIENKYDQLLEQSNITVLKYNLQNNDIQHYKLSIKILKHEIRALTEALINYECSIQNLLNEKTKKIETKFLDMVKESLEFKEIKLSNYFEHNMNFNYEPFYQELKNINLDDENDISLLSSKANSDLDESIHQQKANELLVNNNNNKDVKNSSIDDNIDKENIFENPTMNIKDFVKMPYNINSLLVQNGYGNIIKQAIVDDGEISHEVMIYLLKHQLLQACILNKHLESIITALEWKQTIEYTKAKIKTNYALMQERHIANLEKILEKTKESHEQLRNRVEAVELDAIKLKETMISNIEYHHGSPNNSSPKARILKSFKNEFNRKIKKIKDGHDLSFIHTRIQTEIDEMDATRTIAKNEKPFSFISLSDQKNDSPRGDLCQIIKNFLKEIEKEQLSSNGLPNMLDEAIIMLDSKSQIIEKCKKFILEAQFSSGYGDISSTMYYFNQSEKERLENKIMILQSELDLEITKSEQLKEAYQEANKQIKTLKKLNEEMEIGSKKILKHENENWQKIIDEIKGLNDKEMIRKQEEVTKLHDLLAGWIFKYMELQEQKGIVPIHQEKVLFETFKRKELPDKTLLEKALGTSKNFTKLDSLRIQPIKSGKKGPDVSNFPKFDPQSSVNIGVNARVNAISK